MKNFISVRDVPDINELVQEALHLKKKPYAHKSLGLNKTLGLLFFNPSLRTRLSTQKAAMNLGMNVMVMNFVNEGWVLETADGAVMNGKTVEHIKEAAAVMGEYCDIIGIRSFPKFISREEDYKEEIIEKFVHYSKVPLLSLESATLHPLQSLADLITITENAPSLKKAKVVLTWAPHVKALPQAVANSFAQWMTKADVEFIITHPGGYELSPEFTDGAIVNYNQKEALKDADFVYVKNWSSFFRYGQILPVVDDWLLNKEKMAITNNAKVMHCLPVRRGVELTDDLIDSAQSLILQQASNRVWAAQAVLKRMLESKKDEDSRIKAKSFEYSI